jgi:hypothetical protein
MKEEDKNEQAIANPGPGELTPTELNAVVGGTAATLLGVFSHPPGGVGGCTPDPPTAPTKPLQISVQGQV